MALQEIKAKTILRKYKRVDSWFIMRYAMNLYRGCSHNCAYCDGRAEKYRVDGKFGTDVGIKINAVDILERELDPARKRIPFTPGFFGIGGGVGDSYQPCEKHYRLCRRVLELMQRFSHPVHILTKSSLVEEDYSIIKSINEKKRVLLSMSFSSVDEKLSSLFEPGVPSPKRRLQTLAKFKESDIACGMFLMPVIPFLTDTPTMMEEAIKAATGTGLDYIVFGGMTLKEGRQKEYYMQIIREHFPGIEKSYAEVYRESPWGQANNSYYASVTASFNTLIKKYRIPRRIPARLFSDILDENNLAAVILDQMDWMLKSEGRSSPYGFAGWSISRLKKPLSSMRARLKTLKGVGSTTERIILEILDTGTCKYYEKLLVGDA